MGIPHNRRATGSNGSDMCSIALTDATASSVVSQSFGCSTNKGAVKPTSAVRELNRDGQEVQPAVEIVRFDVVAFTPREGASE